MSLLIKNGTIVTADGQTKADIYCEGEQITRIGKDLEAPPDATVVDATGKYVFPGFIDPHVHVYLPFMGTFAKDDYISASKAALVGGTTTLIEMICQGRDSRPLTDGFEFWMSQAVGKSACDFTFHQSVTRYDAQVEADLKEIVKAGVASFKVFLAYKGAFGITDEELYHTMRLAKQLGVIVTAHCENADLVLALQKQLLSEGKTGPEYHYWSRPPRVEAEGVHHLLTFAEMTGAHTYIVHTSCEEALNEALAGKARGLNVWVETLIQYLLLDKSYAELPNFEGAKYVMSPPLRDKKNQEVFWNALKQRFVATVATDHAPFDFKGQKDMGRDDFTKIPNGIPSLEDRVNLLYTYGVTTGRLDLQTFVDCASTQAAKIFGLFPRKGTIAVGSDADLVVYDPNYRGTISAKTHHLNLDYNAFEGWEIKGRPSVVTVRGEIAVRDGQFVGTIGRGQFLKREPTHF
ncbi:MAG: dihydropyrimidinase [Chloroflexi bacterium]|jgi:dihydropyrimidinase|nr:dihydropyrimidinase [Chloroflexota bacterium]